LLGYLNERLARAYTRGGTFVTAFYAVLDPANRTLVFSRAGHNPPRLVRGGRVVPLDGNGGLPLGILTGQVYEQATVTLEAGDLLLLYTDGITEAMAPLKGGDHRELFGIARLDKLLLDCGAGKADECIGRITTAVAAFTENTPPTDDQTLIAIVAGS
jgi:sigma-B regulation protein RsbU (phosphoserine phosphatase)